MLKIMLVLDNATDQEFLEKVLDRLGFNVIAMGKGVNFSEQLIDHFPDIVFASTLGKNEKILSALAKIKQARGKPKLVFVRQEKEVAPLSAEQKKIIDGVLYSPIDPFKLIDLLASTTPEDISDLRKRYNEMLNVDRGSQGPENKIASGVNYEINEVTHVSGDAGTKSEYGDTTVVGKTSTTENVKIESEKNEYFQNSQPSAQPKKAQKTSSVLVSDPERKKKYDQICAGFEKVDKVARNIDAKKLRSLQKKQSEEIKEDVSVKENRKHFIKTLFSMKPLGLKVED